MKLYLRIIKSPGNAVPLESEKSFDERGGGIGRSGDNDWVLADPDRFLSSCHCLISKENNQFYITDHSTNGTFLNNSSQPIGKDNKVPLNNNDEIELGDYRLSVNIPEYDRGMQASDVFPNTNSSNELPDFFGDSPFPTTDTPQDPFGGSSSISSEFGFPPEENTDPLSALDSIGQASESTPFLDNLPVDDDEPDFSSIQFGSSGSQSDCVDPINQAIKLPDFIDDIPKARENYGDKKDKSSESLEPDLNDPKLTIPLEADVAGSGKSQQFQSGMSPDIVEKRVAQPDSAPSSVTAAPETENTGNAIDKSLITAMGLSEYKLSDVQIRAINGTVGRMMREMLTGMMEILRSRDKIKKEFRMNVTTIQSVENNPLKFSPDVDYSLKEMFVTRDKAYIKPVDAVREGFQDIADHQVALIAGLRAAFESMMKRFDPTTLEKQFDRQTKGSISLSLGKSKYWNAYAEHYKSLADNMESSFQHLFGDQFVQAYEEQLRKLEFEREHKQALQ